MDFALISASIEFAVRWYFGIVVGITLFILAVALFLGISDYIISGRPAFEPVIVIFSPNWFVFIYFSLLISGYAYSFFKAVYQIAVYPPIRFNRQRREVAYVAKRGETPRIIPWEEIIACVSRERAATEYGALDRFALKIGLRDATDGQVVWLTVPSATPQSAVSEWEAIRVYMEEGPAALPVPFMAGMPEEGTVAYFHACRRNYRERHWYIRYVFGFLLIQFCSGWTLPNRIAEWVERLPKTSFPKAVREWSKPLPPEQWATPSAELLEESKAVKRSFRKGVDLFQYFKEKRGEPHR